jgi:hypothetical protein
MSKYICHTCSLTADNSLTVQQHMAEAKHIMEGLS